MMRRIARRMASCRPEVKLSFPEREIGEAHGPLGHEPGRRRAKSRLR